MKRKTTKQFIDSAIKIHNNKYDYSLVDYKNTYTKVKIICKEHGIFEQTPQSHLRGYGCSKCSGCLKKTTEQFIKESNEIHNYEYDYSLVDYKNAYTKVKIICKKHGIFEQQPKGHLSGQKCKRCNTKDVYNTSDFIKKSIKIHNNKYDYSLVDYKNTLSKVKIICKEHGIFEQQPFLHLLNKGCPKCNESKGEKEIRNILKDNNIVFETQKTFNNCKYKNKLRFDFYLPEQNICIEYNGEQHYKPIDYFGGDIKLKYTKHNDQIKTKYCEENNILFICIKYSDNIQEKLNFIFSL